MTRFCNLVWFRELNEREMWHSSEMKTHQNQLSLMRYKRSLQQNVIIIETLILFSSLLRTYWNLFILCTSNFVLFLIVKWCFFRFFFFVSVKGNTWNDVDTDICACFGYGQTKLRCCLNNPHRHFIKHSNVYLWTILTFVSIPTEMPVKFPEWTGMHCHHKQEGLFCFIS